MSFALSGPTTVYLVLYLVTVAIHLVLMGYVVGGALVVAGHALRRGGRPGPVVDTARDWLPFALGAAITAGVGPLLLVQILYREQFYTANLLLSLRWMAVVPVLIVGFYLLYLGKAELGERRARRRSQVRALASLGALACLLFVGFSWTENHLLSLDRAAWVPHFEAGRPLYAGSDRPLAGGALAVRFGAWIALSLPLFATLVAAQLVRAGKDASVRALAGLALAGLAAAVALALAFVASVDPALRAALATPMARAALWTALAGILATTIPWAAMALGRRLRPVLVATAGAGLLLVVGGVSVAREALRLSTVDLAALGGLHARAFESGGLAVFLAFLVINTVAVAWAWRQVARSLHAGKSGSSASSSRPRSQPE